MQTFEIFIDQLEVYGHHGVSAEERKLGHRLMIDLRFEVDSKAGSTDEIGDTVDYGEVSLLAKSVAEDSSCKTLERLANLIADALFARFSRIQNLDISISKPMPPVPAVVDSVGVSRHFERR